MENRLSFIEGKFSCDEMCTKDILCVNYRPSDGGIGDFCLVKAEDGWHFFHNYRDFDQPKDCCILGQEIKLGHALSKNLRNWSWQEPALHVRKGQWDGAHVWAPSVAYSDGMWYMLYTGMGDEIDQKIGLATSKDIWTWAYPKDKPVINVSGYSWAGYNPGGHSNCRNPYVTCFDHHWLCAITRLWARTDNRLWAWLRALIYSRGRMRAMYWKSRYLLMKRAGIRA